MTLCPTFLSWRRWLGGALLLAAPLLGWAQADPPARVAYVSALEGSAQLAMGGGGFAPAALNWPVTTGARIVTDPGSRAELHGGTTALRLAGPADLRVTVLDDSRTQLALTDGTLSLRVRQLAPGERIEIDTPQLAVVAEQPGEYRIDVDPRAGATRLTVHAGSATVYGEAGQAASVGPRQQVLFTGRALSAAQTAAAYRDGFDQWGAARDALEERSASAQYLPRDIPGYAQLDAWGEWAQDASYGAVWYPQVSAAGWAPYREGRWAWVEPWGWTWVDDAPWGFAPFHYGRWAQIGPRWAWVPGRFGPRPVYAPALVGFVGGAAGAGASWGVSLASGPGAAWFPLAPGEDWTPHYRVSDRYRRGLNWADGRERVRPPNDDFYFQRRPGAISVAPVDQFGHPGRRPRFGDGNRLPAGALGGTRVVPPPPRVWVPGVPTQAPLPMPRPDAHGMTDPRRSRVGADRGVAPSWPTPMPGPNGRFIPSDRPLPGDGPAAAWPAAGHPGAGRDPRYPRERDRYLRPPMGERAPLPAHPPQSLPPLRPAPMSPPAMPLPPRMQTLPASPRSWSSGELGNAPQPMPRPAAPPREPPAPRAAPHHNPPPPMRDSGELGERHRMLRAQ